MDHPSTARRPRVGRTVAAAGIAALAVVAVSGAAVTGAAATAPTKAAAAQRSVTTAAAAGRVFAIRPGTNAQARMKAAMEALRPGDTLKIYPGTYGLDLRPDLRLARGTQARRITVTAADPAHPPVLLGAVTLDRADWWVVSNLRIQGNLARRDSLTMNSGTGWMVNGLEVTGAARTGAYANVVITRINGWTTPTRWLFVNSCVHGGGVFPESRRGQLHEIYVTSTGDNAQGLIARNTLFDTPFGAAVKIGNGGVPGAIGPDNVQVANNTMFSNGTQVLLFGRTTGNSVRGNLIVGSTRKLSNGRDTVGIYLNGLTRGPVGTRTNLVQQNDFYNPSYPLYNLGSASGTFRNGGDNNNGAPPAFGSGGCAGLRPTEAHARFYGRYAARNLFTMP